MGGFILATDRHREYFILKIDSHCCAGMNV